MDTKSEHSGSHSPSQPRRRASRLPGHNNQVQPTHGKPSRTTDKSTPLLQTLTSLLTKPNIEKPSPLSPNAKSSRGSKTSPLPTISPTLKATASALEAHSNTCSE